MATQVDPKTVRSAVTMPLAGPASAAIAYK